MAQINKPNQYFNTKLYTGNGGTLNVTGVGFQPDLVWVKSRTQANSHVWFDAIRTFAGGKEIQSNNTGAEGAADSAGYGYISAVSSDGFTAQAGTTAGDYTNVSSQNYASWNWLGANGTAANTDGTISSTVSANTTSGFSIVSYTGTGSAATIGHGLGYKPDVIFAKKRSVGGNSWGGYFSAIGATSNLALSETGGADADASYWGNTEPTSTVFTVSTNANNNASGVTYIAYCFHSVQGYSKFGSYVGNGSTDGTFTYTGFKPAFLLTRKTTGGNWQLWDNKRDTINPNSTIVLPNATNADVTTSSLDTDFLSNGFKQRNTDIDRNASGVNYIYMAFAENPLVGTNNIPATAR